MHPNQALPVPNFGGKSLRQQAREAGLHWATVWARVNKHGWTVEAALATPARDAKFPADDPQYFRRRHLWKNYKMLLEEYEQMLADQGGKCAVCGCAEDTKWTRDRVGFVVDHCHESGKNRGILCHPCNVGLGMFKDNPAALRAAADYIEKK